MFSSGRVKELEAELKEVRAAFEEFVESSKALEDGLDMELTEMNKKLSASAKANEALEQQLQRMQPMLGELETSLDSNKQKLKEESRLRKQAEAAQAQLETLLKEAETRGPVNSDNRAMRQEKDSLREECDALHKELQSKSKQVEAYEQQAASNRKRLAATRARIGGGRNTTSSNQADSAKENSKTLPGGSKVVDSYTEVFDELESVTDQLIATQNKLRETEMQVKLLKASNKAIGGSTGEGAEELAHKSEQNTKGQDSDLRREVQSLRETTNLAQHELDRLQVKLEESSLENATLVEEIACLREVLQDKTDAEATREDIAETIRMTVMAETKEQHAQELAKYQKKREKEINVLREKLKVIVKENATLRQAVDQLQSGVPSYAHKGEINRWKNEVNQLKESIALLKEEHTAAIEDLEKEMEARVARAHEVTRGDMIEASSEAVTAMEDQMEELTNEKSRLEEKVDLLEATVQSLRGENTELAQNADFAEDLLSKTRDELLKLKKTAGITSADLEYTKRSLKKAESEVENVRLEYAEACAELEVARQILDEAGLDEETIAREDEIELKKQIHSLSKSLEQLRLEYADLENDFLDSQHRFCDSQEEASRKSEDEILRLTRKIDELQEELDCAKNQHGDLSALVEQHQQEGDLKATDAKNATLMHELEETKSQIEQLQSENKQLKEDLKEVKDQSTIQVKVLDRLLASKSAFPDSKPEEDGEGVEVIKTPSQENLKPWYSRDPPTSRGNLFGSSIQDETKKLLSTSMNLKKEVEVSRSESSDTASNASDYLVDEDIMEQIKSLQVALEEAEHGSAKVEEMAQRLAVAESKLAATEEELSRTSDENRALKIEVLALKDSVKEARGDLEKTKAELQKAKSTSPKTAEAEAETKSSAKSEGFNEIQGQLKQLADEKAALQHQLDDSKIALSVSHYAQERSKEELRLSESKLLASTDDTQRLRHELQSMSRSLADMKHEYDGVVAELRDLRKRDGSNVNSTQAPDSFAQQLQQLSLENNDLRQAVQEFEDALEQSQKEIEAKSRQVTSLHDALLSTQEETKLLTEEISHLTNAFDTVKAEYNTVVEELDTVNELFDEARDEAGRSGKDTAMEQSRHEMMALRDEERRVMREQVQRVLEENASLQKQVHDVEASLTEAHSMKKTGQEISLIKKEVCILKDALRNSEDEIKALREKEMNLNLELRDSQNDLKIARNELALATQALEQSRELGEKATGTDTSNKSTEHNELRNKLKRLIDEDESEAEATGSDSEDSDSGKESTSLRLKMDLIDMSMTLEKILQENASIEEELEAARRAVASARRDGELDGRMEAAKEIRREMKQERETEMQEIKQKYSLLVEENSSLGAKLREAESKLVKAMQQKDNGKLTEELLKAQNESIKLQEEVASLRAELDALEEEYQEDVDMLQESTNSTNDVKAKIQGKEETQALLASLYEESMSLQETLDKLEGNLAVSRDLEGKKEEMESSEYGQEMEDTSSVVENRASMTEENANRQGCDISVAKDELQVTNSGLFVLRKKQTNNPSDVTGRSGQDGQDCRSTEEDSAIQNGQQASESREEESAPRTKLPVATQPSSKEKSLTSRALEAIAQSKKKNTLRKFDIRAAQNKIQGALAAHVAEKNKEAPELVGLFATNGNVE